MEETHGEFEFDVYDFPIHVRMRVHTKGDKWKFRGLREVEKAAIPESARHEALGWGSITKADELPSRASTFFFHFPLTRNNAKFSLFFSHIFNY